MLILLPPSEGKTEPRSGSPLDLEALSSPSLTTTRRRILDALVRVCEGNATRAAKRLGLGTTQVDELARNAVLHTAPTARADAVYTGVLYAAWNPLGMSKPGRDFGDQHVATTSALFGLVRAGDLIPAYRLSAGVELPRLGSVASLWRKPLGPALDELADGGLLIDLRSGAYVNLHKPAAELAARTAAVRVLSEVNGTRKVVSHFNKATKGEVVRDICENHVEAATPGALADALRDLGWTVELDDKRLDVVI
ncbi:MAG TPA: peroxide stress protein YaaA [Aeromicrobium sp.]|nr:peroxide stress protein YaaA [Aeromicrobium sp.]